MKTTNMDELIIKTEESDGQIIFTIQSEDFMIVSKNYDEENKSSVAYWNQVFCPIIEYIRKKAMMTWVIDDRDCGITQIGPEGAESITFEIKFEIYPKVEIENYKNLGVVLPKSDDLSVSRQEMEWKIDELVWKSHSEHIVIKKPQIIARGDWIMVGYMISDVNAGAGGGVIHFPQGYRIGTGKLIRGEQKISLNIEEKMLGWVGWDMSTGMKEIPITFPNDMKDEEFAGKMCKIEFLSVKVFAVANGIDRETLIQNIMKDPEICPRKNLNTYEFMSFIKEEVISGKICYGFGKLKDAILANAKYNKPISERTIQECIKGKEEWDFGNKYTSTPHIEAEKEIILQSALRYIINKEDLINKVSDEAIEKEYTRLFSPKVPFIRVKQHLIINCAKKMAMELLVKSHLR